MAIIPPNVTDTLRKESRRHHSLYQMVIMSRIFHFFSQYITNIGFKINKAANEALILAEKFGSIGRVNPIIWNLINCESRSKIISGTQAEMREAK